MAAAIDCYRVYLKRYEYFKMQGTLFFHIVIRTHVWYNIPKNNCLRGCFIMTNREYQIYDAIREYTAINGYAPTVREIGQDVGLKSTATVHQYLNRIMCKGYITYHPKQPRTLRVLK